MAEMVYVDSIIDPGAFADYCDECDIKPIIKESNEKCIATVNKTWVFGLAILIVSQIVFKLLI